MVLVADQGGRQHLTGTELDTPSIAMYDTVADGESYVHG
jgi:hypothetical protein